MSKTFFGVTGPGNGSTNEKLVYTLSVTNENSQPKDVSDINKIQATLRGPANETCTVSHNSTGAYHLTCSAKTAGQYKLDVTFNGNKLFPTELETEIAAPNANAQTLSFFLEGDGLHNGRIGETNEFKILVTAAGRPCDIDVSSVQATCIGNKSTTLKIVRKSEGNYLSSFKVGEPGKYKIVVKYHMDDKWQDVIEQPVVFSDDTFGGHVVGKPEENVRLQQLVTFEIQSTDVLGEKVLTGGDTWQALGSGPERVEHIFVTDQRDGSYKVEIKFTKRGQYNIQIVLRGEVEATGSPLRFNVI